MKKYKLKTKFGFTLVELLIAVSISAIVMTSITIFVSSIIRNNAKNEKIINNEAKNITFENKLLSLLDNSNLKLIYSGSSFGWNYFTWYFLSWENPNYPLTFIWIKSFTGYCDSYTWTSDDPWIVNKLIIKNIAYPTKLTDSPYELKIKENKIYNGLIQIIWTWLTWNNLDSNIPLNTELYNPQWIYKNWSYLFIVDTGNDRVLIYDIVTNKIYQFLWIENWIKKPTSIYINWNTIDIASSWNGKTYKYTNTTWNYLNLSWNKLEISSGWSLYPYLSWSTTYDNISDFSLLDNAIQTEYISDFPVKDFEINKTNWIINIKYNYYRNYDCLWENSLLKERVIKRVEWK